jgi:uncharacterized protein YoxC
MASAMSEGLKKTLGILASDKEKKKEKKEADIELLRKNNELIPNHVDMSEQLRIADAVSFAPRHVVTTIPVTENSDLRDDYITSRNITHALIDYAGNALQGALVVALETQHPKAFEVFDKLANTMRGLSKDLIDMQKIYQSIVDSNNGKIAQNITQNNITINPEGDPVSTTNTSMSDIVKLIKKMSDKSVAENQKSAMKRKVIVSGDDADDADFIEMEG